MKQLITIILITLWPFLSIADTRKTAEMGVTNDLVMEISFRINSSDKELPESWDDFESVVMMKNGSLKHQLFRAKAMNSFALVPGAPIIESQPGISREYQGHRLFLISREESSTRSQESGRYAILIKPEELDSKPVRIFSHFIPEDTAKLILNQIPNFDPSHQPPAFEDLSPFEREKQQFSDHVWGPRSWEERSRGDGSPPVSGSSDDAKAAREAAPVSGWLIAGSMAVLILVLASWMKFRKSQSTS